jgi:hypothetical protein
MARRNLFALDFFGGDDCEESDYKLFGQMIGSIWPVSRQQIMTAVATAKSFPDCTAHVYHRPNRDVLMIEINDFKGVSRFASKINRMGHYE